MTNSKAESEIIRIPLTTQKVSTREVEALVRRTMGTSFFLSELPSARNEEVYSFGTVKEQHLWDASEGFFKVRFTPFRDVFETKVDHDEGGWHLDLPNRKFVAERIESKFGSFRSSSEGALLGVIGGRFLRLYQIRNQMNPLYEIVTNVVMRNTVKASDFVHGRRSKTKVNQYLRFLVELEILKKEDGQYVFGEIGARKLKEDSSLEDLYATVLSESILKGHAYMADLLHFTHITPFIRLTNSNYLPSYFADRRLGMSDKDLSEYQHRLYGIKPKPQSKVLSRASQMAEIGVFSVERGRPVSLFKSSEHMFAEYVGRWKDKASAFVA